MVFFANMSIPGRLPQPTKTTMCPPQPLPTARNCGCRMCSSQTPPSTHFMLRLFEAYRVLESSPCLCQLLRSQDCSHQAAIQLAHVMKCLILTLLQRQGLQGDTGLGRWIGSSTTAREHLCSGRKECSRNRAKPSYLLTQAN